MGGDLMGLFAFIDFLEEKKFYNLFQRLVDTEFCFGKIEHAVHFITMVDVVMHHVGQINPSICMTFFHS